MAYLLPGVRVEQILVSPTANLVDTDLLPTVIGPVYRVVRDRLMKSQGTLDVNLSGPAWATVFPVIDPGAKIDAGSVEVWLKDAWALLVARTTGANLKTYNGNYLSGFQAGMQYFDEPDLTVDFLQMGVIRGDRLQVGSSNHYYVIDKVEARRLYFRELITKTIPDDNGVVLNKVGYLILRFYASFQIDSLDYRVLVIENRVEIDTFAYVSYEATYGLDNSITYTPVSHPFITGQVNFTYRACRADLVGLKRYASTVEVEVDMENDVLNPLGTALCRGAFAANGNTTPVLAYCLSENTTSAYIDALAELATFKETYLLVPLTMSATVINSYAAHVNAMSAQPISYFRILFGSRELVTENVLLPLTSQISALDV